MIRGGIPFGLNGLNEYLANMYDTFLFYDNCLLIVVLFYVCGCPVPLPLGAHSLYVICDCGIS